jgi:CheY-specific phosphatase CheX
MTSPLDPDHLSGIGHQALEEVLSGFLALDATPSGAPQESELAAMQGWLMGQVPLQAERRSGWVRITLPEPLANRAADHLFGPGVADPTDLMGEFTNLVAGRIASGLATHGLTFTLHTPTVQRLEAHPGHHAGQVRSHWRFWDHPLTLDILVTEHTP